MRLTKIYGRKYSRFLCFTVGALLTFGVSMFYAPETTESTVQVVESQADTAQLKDLLDGYRIVSSWNPPNQLPSFELDNKGQRLTSIELRSMGFDLTVQSSCRVVVSSGLTSVEVHC